jgi:hypothetical protein
MHAVLLEQRFDQLADLPGLLLPAALALEVGQHDADVVGLALLSRDGGKIEAGLQQALPVVVEQVLETGGARLGCATMYNDLAGHHLSLGNLAEDWHLPRPGVKPKATLASDRA